MSRFYHCEVYPLSRTILKFWGLKKAGTYDPDELREKQKSFGTIVLECDLDLLPETVYTAYDSRWEIEIVMRYYKSACEFDDTRVQDDYSGIGSEFCDFLSSVLTFRLLKRFNKAQLLEDKTYKKLMSVLDRAKKARSTKAGEASQEETR